MERPLRADLLLKVIVGTALIVFGNPALAYIGPGAGLGAIGTILALVGGVILAIVGFVWYPIKRLLRRLSKNKDNTRPK